MELTGQSAEVFVILLSSQLKDKAGLTVTYLHLHHQSDQEAEDAESSWSVVVRSLRLGQERFLIRANLSIILSQLEQEHQLSINSAKQEVAELISQLTRAKDLRVEHNFYLKYFCKRDETSSILPPRTSFVLIYLLTDDIYLLITENSLRQSV